MNDIITAIYPANAALCGETVQLMFRGSWESEVDRLAEHIVYGPEFRPLVAENLGYMSKFVGWGDMGMGLMYLSRAMRHAPE